MSDINSIIVDRLQQKNTSNDIPSGWLHEIVEAEFSTNNEAVESLQRIKELVEIIATIKNKRKDWPNLDEWKNILPIWLLQKFRPEFTKEELDLMFKTKQWSQEWTLKNWIGNYKEKVWEWWGGEVKDNKLVIEILVDGHPFSIYDLKCTLELIGAKSVKLVD